MLHLDGAVRLRNNWGRRPAVKGGRSSGGSQQIFPRYLNARTV